MDNTTSDFQKVLKPETSLLELNTTNMEVLHNFSELNHPLTFLDYFSNNNFPNSLHTSHHQPNYVNELQFSSGCANDPHQKQLCPFEQMNPQGVKSLPSDFGVEKNHDKSVIPLLEITEMGTFGRKRKRKNEEKEEKQREVIHVRAKRGQATDSHSLAERVRRERINEKLRVLQDIVPGCYKTMGMAVMLDVIINYVRSLQNQIEFLSMKISTASLFYNFNSPEAEALEALHTTANPRDEHVHEAEKIPSEEQGGILSWVQSTWPPNL